jgi:hypothetical protein
MEFGDYGCSGADRRGAEGAGDPDVRAGGVRPPGGAIAHTLAKRFNVPAAPHVYHRDLPEMVDVWLQAGHTSVMLD